MVTAELVTLSFAAVIFVVPAATAVNNPDELIVPTEVLEDVHVTDDVRLDVVPSEYVPVALHCVVCPAVTEDEAHETEMDFNVLL